MRPSKDKPQEEPRLSDEEHRMISEWARDSRKRTTRNRRKTMNPLLKQYLEKNKVLIQYVRNVFGFKKGIVVAISKDGVGWSLVNNTLDIQWRKASPMSIPPIQRMANDGKPLLEIMKHPAYVRAVKSEFAIRVPQFDVDIGLMKALGRALDQGEKEKVIEPIPKDMELAAAIERMVERAKRYYKQTESTLPGTSTT
jgi:hypothetical protein